MKPKAVDNFAAGRGRPFCLSPTARGIAGRSGFSIIELLVAMVLLLVITAVFGRFFQRSTQSWEGGMRTVEVMIAGRTAVNVMSRDIERAIADPVLAENFEPESIFRIDDNNDNNELHLVVMTRDGAQSVQYYQEDDVLKRSIDGQEVPLIEDVVRLKFFVRPRVENELPAEVGIKLRLRSRYDDSDSAVARAREVEFVSRVHPVHRDRYPDTGTEGN